MYNYFGSSQTIIKERWKMWSLITTIFGPTQSRNREMIPWRALCRGNRPGDIPEPVEVAARDRDAARKKLEMKYNRKKQRPLKAPVDVGYIEKIQ